VDLVCFCVTQFGGIDLGAKLLSTILYSLVIMGAVDIFSEWYRNFLNKRGVDHKFVIFLHRATFVILAFIFWQSLIREQEAAEFAPTHFFFALFIYCLYRLVASFFKGKAERS
jgi:hypothetical protein